jgi:hypothetical protein
MTVYQEQGPEWRYWLEDHLVKAICGAVVIACLITVGVTGYFSWRAMKQQQELADGKLNEAKSALTARLDEVETRSSGIERHIGTEARWDVSALTITPTEVKELGRNFVYNDKIRAYLSMSGLKPWQFIETDELEFGAMVTNESVPPVESGLGILGQMAKEQKVCLWKGEEAIPVDRGGSTGQKLLIFPYVAVEVVTNEDFLGMVAKLSSAESGNAVSPTAKLDPYSAAVKSETMPAVGTRVSANPISKKHGNVHDRSKNHTAARTTIHQVAKTNLGARAKNGVATTNPIRGAQDKVRKTKLGRRAKHELAKTNSDGDVPDKIAKTKLGADAKDPVTITTPDGDVKDELATIVTANLGEAAEKEQENALGFSDAMLEELSRLYNSDAAGFFLYRSIVQDFQLSLKNRAIFRILDAERKGNVLYLHAQTVFPSTDQTGKVYWDREIICIGGKEATYLITTSAPSRDLLPSAGPWITAWLSGLRIPWE